MNCEFSYKHFIDMIKLIKEKGYEFIFFKESGNFDKEIILRHDIDLSIDKALEMAKIEKKLNVKASYFFWLTSPFYNLFDDKNVKSILEIHSMGHEIALHFNENAYEYNSEICLEKKINKELSILKNYYDIDIKTVSFHMPNKNILNNNFKWNNVINTYHNKFFTNYKYLSDSEMRWREGCLCMNYHKYNKIQVLIHPVWWNNEKMNKMEVKNIYFNKYSDRIIREWDSNIKV